MFEGTRGGSEEQTTGRQKGYWHRNMHRFIAGLFVYCF